MKSKMQKRSYDQWCAVARALDTVGERWTLLLVRDLLIGPKRYKDILSGSKRPDRALGSAGAGERDRLWANAKRRRP